MAAAISPTASGSEFAPDVDVAVRSTRGVAIAFGGDYYPINGSPGFPIWRGLAASNCARATSAAVFAPSNRRFVTRTSSSPAACAGSFESCAAGSVAPTHQRAAWLECSAPPGAGLEHSQASAGPTSSCSPRLRPQTHHAPAARQGLTARAGEQCSPSSSVPSTHARTSALL